MLESEQGEKKMTTKLTFSELLERAKREKIKVHTPTEEQAKKLLKALDERGYEWASETKLTIETWYAMYKENTCYHFELNKKVWYCSLDFYQKEGYKIVEFSDIDFTDKKMNDNKIMRLEKDQYGNCFKVIKGRYFIISLEEYNQLLKDMWEDK